jgi:hypothetical protein
VIYRIVVKILEGSRQWIENRTAISDPGYCSSCCSSQIFRACNTCKNCTSIS